jgi:hypothetical protein
MPRAFINSGFCGIFLAFLLILFAPAALQLQVASAYASDDGFFSLEPVEDDSPSILKYKAALRIFGGVQAVYHLTNKCNAAKTWAGYEKRNGNSLAMVVRQFELGGGLGIPQKTAIDAYADGQVKEALSLKNCSALIKDIDSQEWDIYKGARFQEDYTLIKSR